MRTLQVESVVLVGLALDIAPFPGIFIGRAHEGLQPEADGKIVDPTRRAAGLRRDQIDLVLLEHRSQVASIGCRRQELVLTRMGVEKAAHRLELTQVESENFHRTST